MATKPEMQAMTDTAARAKMDSSLLLGHSADWWDGMMILSLVVVFFAGGLVAAMTAGAVISHKREAVAAQEELNRYKSEAAARVAEAQAAGEEAKADAGRANEASGKANERAAALEKEAAGARERAERLEKENLQLRKDFSPRRISKSQHDALVSALTPLHGTIYIESMTDSESGMYAGDILQTFKDSGWTIGGTSYPLGETWEGLIFENTADPTTNAVAKAFSDAGIADLRSAPRGKPSVTILVGGKPRSF